MRITRLTVIFMAIVASALGLVSIQREQIEARMRFRIETDEAAAARSGLENSQVRRRR